MSHPFDNPYAEQEVRDTRVERGELPSFEQFRDWTRHRGMTYSAALLLRIYRDPIFQRGLSREQIAEMTAESV